MRFPLPFVPKISYKGGNGFGANRDKVRMGLRHAANDLSAPHGTPVLAMDAGVVLEGTKYFYSDTYVLVIQHPQFIARYGEIAQAAEVQAGDTVVEGQVIAYVGDQAGDDMLHIEFFTGKLQGSFSTQPGTHRPYDRRDDVFDGSKFLDQTVSTVTHWDEKGNVYRYDVDKDGRKFIQRMDLRDI
jgi:hypothetical protein